MMGDRSEDNNRSTRGYELMVNESGGLKQISSGAKLYVSEASFNFVHDFLNRDKKVMTEDVLKNIVKLIF